MSDNQQQDTLDVWAVVEVLGHHVYAGRVTETTLAGVAFLRVDIPELPDRAAAFTKYVGGSSIYAITPCTEAVARRVAEERRARPVELVDLNARPAIAAPDDDEQEGDIPF